MRRHEQQQQHFSALINTVTMKSIKPTFSQSPDVNEIRTTIQQKTKMQLHAISTLFWFEQKEKNHNFLFLFALFFISILCADTNRVLLQTNR